MAPVLHDDTDDRVDRIGQRGTGTLLTDARVDGHKVGLAPACRGHVDALDQMKTVIGKSLVEGIEDLSADGQSPNVTNCG